MGHVCEGRCEGMVPDEESQGPCNIFSKNLNCNVQKTASIQFFW